MMALKVVMTVVGATAVTPIQKVQELATARLCEEDSPASASAAFSLLQMAGAFLVIAIGLLLSAATFLFELLKNGFHRNTKESAEHDREAEIEMPELPVAPQSSSTVGHRQDDVIIASTQTVMSLSLRELRHV